MSIQMALCSYADSPFSLGENLYTLSAMYSFMLDRVTAVDYESTLLLAMLKVRTIALPPSSRMLTTTAR